MTSEQLKQKERKLNVSYNRFFFGMVIILIMVFAFKKTSPKTYSVSKPLEEWQSDFDTLTRIQVNIGYAMSKQDADYYQEALGRLMNRLRTPLIIQIQEEQLKIKKDSINTIKPKK
jgi:hypothetical protein